MNGLIVVTVLLVLGLLVIKAYQWLAVLDWAAEHEHELKRMIQCAREAHDAAIDEEAETMAKKKNRKGDRVVYRLGPYSIPKLGVLHGRNKDEHWEKGAWIVRDENDGKLYVLASSKGATFRVADKADMERYDRGRKHRKHVASSMSEAHRFEREWAPDSAPKPEKKQPTAKSFSDEAAETIEKEGTK